MRIKFNKLTVASGKIGVSLNNGQSFEKYDINDQLIESGIELSPEQQFDQVILRGDATTLKNLEVINYFDVTNKVYLAASIESRKSEWENYVNSKIPLEDVTATILDAGSSYSLSWYEGIIVNKFWLKDKFELDNFGQKQCLVKSDTTGNRILTAIGYSDNGQGSTYDLFFLPKDSYIICGNKYFHVLKENEPDKFPSEDDIIVKDLPSASIFFKGESVYSKAGLFINIKSELEEIVSQHSSDFAHYDYTLTSQVNGGTATTIGTINNKTVALNNGVSNIYTSGVSIQITKVGEHEYNYIAHNVDDDTPYNITFTEQNKPELPPEPTRELGHFEGWFMDEECTQPLNWGDIDEDSHIYAKWTYDDAKRKFYLEENSNIFVEITQPYNSTISLAEVQAKFTEKYGDKVTINAIPEVVFNTNDAIKLTEFTLANVKLDFTLNGERILGDDALDVPFGSSINTESLLNYGRSDTYLAIYNKHPIYAHQYFYASTSSLYAINDINIIPLSIGTGGYYLSGADELSQKFLSDFNIGSYFSEENEIPSPINLTNSPFEFTFKIGDTNYIPENGYFDFKKLPSPNHSVSLTVTATAPNNTLQVSKGTTAQTSVTIDNIFATTSRETLASLISNEDLANVNLCKIKANLYGKEVTVGSEGLPPVSLAATGTEYSLTYTYLPYSYNASANIVYIDEEDKNCTLPITITDTETPGEYTLAFGAPEDPNNAFPDEAPDEWNLTVSDAWDITVTPSEDPRTSVTFQLNKSTTEQAQFTLTMSYPQEENISRDNIYIVDDDFKAPGGDYEEPTE